jgi:cytochrome b
LAQLASLVVQVLTGLASDDDIFSSGPLAKYLSDETVSLAHSVHHLNWNVLTVLILLHVGAIVFYWLRGKNLVKPMVTGFDDRSDNSAQQPDIRRKPLWLSVIVAGAAATLAWWVFTL